jgi:hypothetical protein
MIARLGPQSSHNDLALVYPIREHVPPRFLTQCANLQGGRMPIDPLQLPVYGVICPACQKSSLYSLVQVVTNNHLSCPLCFERLEGVDYYSKSKATELLKSLGYSGDHISVNE